MQIMKIKAAILFTFLLFFSFFNTGNAVLTEETRVNVVSEYQLFTDECSDDLEFYAEIKSAEDISLPPILHTTETAAISVFAFDLLEPPKSSSFIS